MEYKHDDLFWDIESLSDLFTLALYYPAQHKSIIYYIADDDKVNQTIKQLNAEEILKTIPTLDQDMEVEIKPLTVLKNYRELAKTFGVTFGTNEKDRYIENVDLKNPKPFHPHHQIGGIRNGFPKETCDQIIQDFQSGKPVNRHFNIPYEKNNVSEHYIDQMNSFNNANANRTDIDEENSKVSGYLHSSYYPMKETDPLFERIGGLDKFGRRFGYNDANYDRTMLSGFFNALTPENILNFLGKDQDQLDPDTDIKSDIPSAKTMRAYNDQLFSNRFIKNMNERLTYDFESTVFPSGFGSQNYSSNSWNLKKAWEYTNRYIDVARLNEKMTRVGLDRLLGMLGRNIVQYSGLGNSDTTFAEMENQKDALVELIAYNISDVVDLKYVLEAPLYQNTLKLRSELLTRYPETVYLPAYNPDTNSYEPLQRPWMVQRDRLTVNSTSAKFVEKIIAPYWQLKDIETVSFMYPSESKAKELGIERFNVLDYCKEFFDKHFTDPTQEAYRKFDDIYHFFKSIEGKNFNDTSKYNADYPNSMVGLTDASRFFKQLMDDGEEFKADKNSTKYRVRKKDAYQKKLNAEQSAMKQSFQNMFEKGSNIDLYSADGKPLGTNAKFGVGGIHGECYNLEKYRDEQKSHQNNLNKLNAVKTAIAQKHFSDKTPEELIKLDQDGILATTGYNDDEFRSYTLTNSQTGESETIDIKSLLKSKSTKKSATFKVYKEPNLFIHENKRIKINDRYRWTTQLSNVNSDTPLEADFKSYYPLLLTMMSVFKGDRDVDVYEGLYNQKADIDRMKDNGEIKPDDFDDYMLQRNLIKLLLNSATGAGNARFENNIRVDNAIISMRIIGQLFDWLVAQTMILKYPPKATTFLLNTDAVLTNNITEEQAAETLEELNKNIHIEIEPVPFQAVASKDANNKIVNEDGKIDARGNIKAYNEPSLEQNLDHPAIIDRLIGDYMIDESNPNSCNQPFNKKRAEELLNQVEKEYLGVTVDDETTVNDIDKNGLINLIIMFQTVVASSPGKHTFTVMNEIPLDDRFDNETNQPFVINPNATLKTLKEKIYPVGRYERVFMVKPSNEVKTIHSVTHRKEADKNYVKKLTNTEMLERTICMHLLQTQGVLDNINGEKSGSGQRKDFDATKEKAKFMKIRGIDSAQPVEVINKDLHKIPASELLAFYKLKIDKQVYLDQMKSSFLKNWSNVGH